MNQDIELQEWIESLQAVIDTQGKERASELLTELLNQAQTSSIPGITTTNTPYVNTVTTSDEISYPGDLELEQKIENAIRWNAMAMVVRANKAEDGIGGHISTYASSASIYEVCFNHFFRGKEGKNAGDMIYFQGHGSPGMYARAFLEGRLPESQLVNFRQELKNSPGLSSYPHPYLMPSFWEFPTVSMGLGPITAIYQARFNRYLENRGLIEPGQSRVWAFLGDGETDEPESLGALQIAAREKLDNLTFVVNCNLQRLDGPVRGNGKIIQDLEGQFRGAGWDVTKIVWGSAWDDLFARDSSGLLSKRLGEIVDGEYQKYSVSDGAYIREKLFGKHPELLDLVSHLSDEQIASLPRGGHDKLKIFNGLNKAVNVVGKPSVVLVKTVKGFGLGASGAGQNSTHQKKKLEADTIKFLRDNLQIPVSDKDLEKIPFYKPDPSSPEMKYLLERRRELQGPVPSRRTSYVALNAPKDDLYAEFKEGTKDREVSTTMAFVRILSKLLKDKNIGKFVVPIVPDESRTFGMEALFGQIGIYSAVGQNYEPVDAGSLLYYKESKSGQYLQEGINEAGAMSSFIAVGASHITNNLPMIPFYIYYSMFGLQRVGDLVWSAADQGCRGFMLGATAGRTTLSGEGLQHQDGNSHLLAYPVPTLKAYDPAFAYELAAIIKQGIYEMYEQNENWFYYITLGNENYVQLPQPSHVKNEDITSGMYRFQKSNYKSDKKAHVFGSGAILNEAIKAAKILETQYQVSTDIWSITSYKALHENAMDIERWNILHPEAPKESRIEECLNKETGVFVCASDYTKAMPNSIAKWFPRKMIALGTDGFGRSAGRGDLRSFFEVDANSIVANVLSQLMREEKINTKFLEKAMKDLAVNPAKNNPITM
jgi:pyruvate dehydrogenase E1 component